MKYEISETSRLWLSGDTATLLVHNSSLRMLIGWFSMTAGTLLFVAYYFFKPDSFFALSGFILLLYGLLSFGYKEFVVIDPKRKMIKRKMNILHFCFYKTVFYFDETASFKYAISFNSLEPVSFISLMLHSADRGELRLIVNFPEEKSFFAFKKLFDQKFPQYQITETDLSKAEFEQAQIHRKQIKSSHDRVRRFKDHLL